MAALDFPGVVQVARSCRRCLRQPHQALLVLPDIKAAVAQRK
jgi:hypothetical protein